MSPETKLVLEYLIWVVLLAALLFIPVSKLIWVFSVRRFEKRTNRKLTEEEQQGQKRRAWVIAFILVTIFSVLFNMSHLSLTPRG